MSRTCQYLTTSFGFVLATAGFVLGFWVFPNLLNSQIDDTIKLVNGTEAFDRWQKIPIPLQLKVYFFNVTNPNDVQNGVKPIVKEVGPYVYDQQEEKYNITQDKENLIYYQNHTLTFNPMKSEPYKENDSLVVPNLPLMSILNTMKLESSDSKIKLFNQWIGAFANNPKDLFLRTTSKEFLFDGIEFNCKAEKHSWILENTCKEIMKRAPEQIKRVNDSLRFSLLTYKNFTHDGLYKINSGVENIDLLGEVLEWKNSSKLNIWEQYGNSTCNDIYGSDTTLFPPRRDQKSILRVFQSDICRSLKLYFNEEVQYKDIPALRYVLKEDSLGSPSNFSGNECFCLNKTGGILGEDDCLFDGAMELQSCLNSPIVLTFPHFYMAHEKYKSTIEGFEPKKSQHQTFVDLEPNTGVILRGSKRAQFNIFYQPIKGIDLTTNLRDTLMPVVWIDQGVELSDEYTDKIKKELMRPKFIMEVVYWSMIGVGLLIGILGLIWSCIFTNKPKKLL